MSSRIETSFPSLFLFIEGGVPDSLAIFQTINFPTGPKLFRSFFFQRGKNVMVFGKGELGVNVHLIVLKSPAMVGNRTREPDEYWFSGVEVVFSSVSFL